MLTIDRPDVIGLIEQVARRPTGGDTTEAIALAMRRLLEQDARVGSLAGSLWVRENVDLITAGVGDEVGVANYF